MSMHEALRGLRGMVDWLRPGEGEIEDPPALPTPLEEAAAIVAMATRVGTIDRESPTWNGVARWAANELLVTHIMLETAAGERAEALRARCHTLRDLLTIDDRQTPPVEVLDFGPDIP